MSTSEDGRNQFAGQVRVLQIIVAAITFAPLVYLSVVFSTAPPVRAAGGFGGISLTYLACGMAATAVVAWLIVPPLVTTRLRRQIAAGAWPPQDNAANALAVAQTDSGNLCAAYTIRTIIAVAVLEGATFFLVCAYQQERDMLALVFAMLLTLLIAFHLPTRTRVADWIERQLVRLADDRDSQPRAP